MKRYLLFAGLTYYPGRAWNDLIGSFDAIGEAVDALDTEENDWAQIVDLEQGKIVLQGKRADIDEEWSLPK